MGNKIVTDIVIYNPRISKPMILPGVELPNYYYIDIYGNIYSALLRGNLSQYQNTKGYMLVSLQTVEGKRIQERVHRLVKYNFDYFPGCENYQIDHIDGNKANNCLSNLDWVTAKENIRRAEENNLRAHCVKLSSSDKIKIAELIAEGHSNEEIQRVYPDANDMVIGEILQRPRKNGISLDLAYKARNVRREIVRKSNRTSVSEEQMHDVCKYFEENKPSYELFDENRYNKRKYLKEAMKSTGLDYSNKDQRNVCRRLLNKENNSVIFSQYNY